MSLKNLFLFFIFQISSIKLKDIQTNRKNNIKSSLVLLSDYFPLSLSAFPSSQLSNTQSQSSLSYQFSNGKSSTNLNEIVQFSSQQQIKSKPIENDISDETNSFQVCYLSGALRIVEKSETIFF